MNEIIEFIVASGNKPVSSYKLTELFGVSGVCIRRIVNAARCSGYPICSCRKGYYYSTTNEDVQYTIDSLKSRIESIQGAINGLEKYLVGGP